MEFIAEACRLRLMAGLEEQLSSAGYARVAGVDEAGRGCLAGPVVAAAVIPDPGHSIPGVDDSKHLDPERRRRIATAVRTSAVAWAVAVVDPATIDRINILEATRLAMRRALATLAPAADAVVIDAVPLSGLAVPSLPVVRADQVCYGVACASILAKVERDRLMALLDADFPHYGFADHKGYAAEQHLAALRIYGPSPVHRLTFRSVVPRRGEPERLPRAS